MLGSVDWCRGILALTAGAHALATDHLRSALALEERIEAPLLQARTHAWLAATIRLQGAPDDGHAEAARRLAVPAGTALSAQSVLAIGT